MYTTGLKSTDTKTIRMSDGGNKIGIITAELTQQFDLSGGRIYDLIGGLTSFVREALVSANTLRPQRADFNAYNATELEDWGIHGFLNIKLYDSKRGEWVPIDLRKGTPQNENPIAKKKTAPSASLSPLEDTAVHISRSDKLGRKWEGISVSVDALAAPLIEKYSKGGDLTKRAGEVAQQLTNMLWQHVTY